MANKVLNRAGALAKAGDARRAYAVLVEAEKRDPDPRLKLQRASLMLDADDASAALELLESLCEQHPNYVPAHLFAGIAAFDCGLFERAAEALARACELAPQNGLAASYRALVWWALGRDRDAARLVRAWGFSDNRGFLTRLTEWIETRWLETGLFFGPRQLPARLADSSEAGRRLFRRAAVRRAFFAKRYEEFLAGLLPAVRAGNADPSDVYACAVACEMMHAYEQALQLLNALSPSDREADPVLALRARCEIRLGHYEEGLTLLEKVFVSGPEDFGVNYYLGVLSLAQGDRRAARKFFRRAYTDYLVDTLDFQFWQIEHALLPNEGSDPVVP